MFGHQQDRARARQFDVHLYWSACREPIGWRTWSSGTNADFILTGPDLIQDGQRPKGWTLDRDPFLLETNVPGIFAVGDVRHGSVKRVASGVGEGSVAVQFIHQYLSKV